MKTAFHIAPMLQEHHQRVAIHEAGHAVIAAVLGLHVREIAIGLGRRSNAPGGYSEGGHVVILDGWEIDNDRRWYRHDRDKLRSRRSRNIAFVSTMSAGYLAELVILGTTSGEYQRYSVDDRLRTKRVKAAGLTSKQDVFLFRQTYRLIRRHRKKIINMAEAVLAHPRGRIGRRTIKRIMKGEGAA